MPHDGVGGLARRNQRTQHEPAVLRAVPPIKQHKVGRIRRDVDPGQRIIHSQGDALALGKRQRLSVSLGLVPVFKVVSLFRFISQRQRPDHWIVRRAGEDAGFASVHQVSLAHVDRGQELQVEACSPGKFLRQRLVEINADFDAAWFRCHFQGVAQIEGWKSEVSGEPVVRLIGLTVFEGGDQVPLLGSWHQAHVAVGGDACPMENHLHGGVLLVYEHGMVRAVVEENTKALGIKVILVSHLHGKVGAEQAWAGEQGQEKTNSDRGEHRL